MKRAKSTVGVPLTRDTPVPLQSLDVKASTAVSTTENEVTLAMGASVPTTNDAPVGPFVGFVELFAAFPEQPATSSEPAVIARSERRKFFPWVLKGISNTSLSAVVRGLHGTVALELTHSERTNASSFLGASLC